MKQEDKEILIKDFCARLPYEVQCKIGGLRYGPYTFTGNDVEDLIAGRMFKPYLRPMSSMTEEESKEYRMFIDYSYNDFTSKSTPCVYVDKIENYIKWLDSKYFDWRTDDNGKTLIEKGLALEAPKDMYK